MASPEVNRIRIAFGMEPEPPHIVDMPYSDPGTPSEYVANSFAILHNRAELGEISDAEASEEMHRLDEMRAGWGDGWKDRYGPLPDYTEGL